jgi:hypothetical protein
MQHNHHVFSNGRFIFGYIWMKIYSGEGFIAESYQHHQSYYKKIIKYQYNYHKKNK